VPVVIDDALGYSDPDRLERLGAVLAEAGRDAQVLVLTCVPERYRAVGTAKAVRLEPMATRGGATGPAPTDLPPVGPAADAAQVLACLRQAGRPLGRAEVLAATGLDEARWSATIRHLLDTGQVLQEGVKRRARYRPAEP
jgi:hypothetical protein